MDRLYDIKHHHKWMLEQIEIHPDLTHIKITDLKWLISEIERLKLELKEIEEEQNNLGIERDLLT